MEGSPLTGMDRARGNASPQPSDGGAGESPCARPGPPEDLEPGDLRPLLESPFCGRAVPYPGRAGDGSPALAECPGPRCDVYFDFPEADVYAA
jgi:hypothetical protein